MLKEDAELDDNTEEIILKYFSNTDDKRFGIRQRTLLTNAGISDGISFVPYLSKHTHGCPRKTNPSKFSWGLTPIDDFPPTCCQITHDSRSHYNPLDKGVHEGALPRSIGQIKLFRF